MGVSRASTWWESTDRLRGCEEEAEVSRASGPVQRPAQARRVPELLLSGTACQRLWGEWGNGWVWGHGLLLPTWPCPEPGARGNVCPHRKEAAHKGLEAGARVQHGEH